MSFCASSVRRKRTKRLSRWPWSEHSCHPYQARSILQASECKAYVTFEPLITCPCGETGISWTLSMCTVLSVILAQTHPFNCEFPLCLVCIVLRFRGRTELTSLKKDQCYGVGCPLTVKIVFIYVIIVTCNLYKHTSGNVWYYPKYITLGNYIICSASAHCLYIIIWATVSHSTEHGDELFRPRHVTNCNSKSDMLGHIGSSMSRTVNNNMRQHQDTPFILWVTTFWWWKVIVVFFFRFGNYPAL